ncbi:hypothetical protein ABZP36_028663 [Zizania latifolia]
MLRVSNGGAAAALGRLLVLACMARWSAGVGVNWGTQLSHPLPVGTVVQLLKDNGFDKVKLFDAEDGILGALKGSGVQVMVGIPNDMLAGLAAGAKAAEDWVAKNVSKHVNNGVDISAPAHTHTDTQSFENPDLLGDLDDSTTVTGTCMILDKIRSWKGLKLKQQ